MENNDGVRIGGNADKAKISNKVKKTETNISIKYIKKVSFWSGFGGGVVAAVIVGIILLIIEYGLFNK
jgi:hypothetical protein